MNLPKSWNDITVRQFVEIREIEQTAQGIDSQLEVLGVLTDLPIEDIEDLDFKEYENLLSKFSFIASSPSQNYVKSIGKYKFKEFNKLKVEEFLDLEYFFTKDYLIHLPHIVSILYKNHKINEWENLIFEPHEYDIEERFKEFLDVSINSVFGVIQYYLSQRENFLNTYSNLFEEPITDEELEEVEPEDRKELEAEKRLSKWAWEKTIYQLANEDVTKMSEVLGMNLIFAFNMLSMKKDTEG